MEKEKPKKRHPQKYPKTVVNKVLTLVREGKTMDEILEQVEPRKRCIMRIARKNNLEIKK